MTAKNFEEKALSKANEEFIAASNKHGEDARRHFANVIAYTLRTGNKEIINRLFTGMENGGDKLAFVAGYRQMVSFDGVKMLVKDETRCAEILTLAEAAGIRSVNLFTMGDKGVEHVKDNPVSALFKRSLTEAYKSDEDMTEALAPVFVKSNKRQGQQATQAFNASVYLKQVIDTIIRKDGNSEEATKLAAGLNNVIKATFGREAALSDSDIKAKLETKETDEQRKLREAMELIAAKGGKVEMAKPSVVIDHTPAKADNLEERRKSA